jgi:hypothetical protein
MEGFSSLPESSAIAIDSLIETPFTMPAPCINRLSVLTTPEFDLQNSPLTNLATELLQYIAQFLDQSLLELRYSCKEMEYKMRTFYYHKYFSTRQVWINYNSLNTLHNLSEDWRVGPVVRRLVVSLHHYSLRDVNQTPNGLLKARYEDQKSLICRGDAETLLRNAITNLKNLQAVEIIQDGDWQVVQPDNPSEVAES